MTSMRGLLSRMLLSVATAMLPLIACTDAAHAAAKGSKVILLTVSRVMRVLRSPPAGI